MDGEHGLCAASKYVSAGENHLNKTRIWHVGHHVMFSRSESQRCGTPQVYKEGAWTGAGRRGIEACPKHVSLELYR